MNNSTKIKTSKPCTNKSAKWHDKGKIQTCLHTNADLSLSFSAAENTEKSDKTVDTLMCLNVGTPKSINFPLSVPIFKHIMVQRLMFPHAMKQLFTWLNGHNSHIQFGIKI